MTPVLVDNSDGVATLTLNSPASRNALSRAMLAALSGALAAIAAASFSTKPCAPARP
jgi:enoyl-CoA hydratase/carnithine racemase